MLYPSYSQPTSVEASASDITVCNGDEIQLFVLASGGTEPYEYSWSSNPVGFTSTDQNPFVSPTENTTYTVTVTDAMNGSLSDDVEVSVQDLSPSLLQQEFQLTLWNLFGTIFKSIS
ncbi:MAG: PKD domain-containing protein [Bacteroidales bacterium]